MGQELKILRGIKPSPSLVGSPLPRREVVAINYRWELQGLEVASTEVEDPRRYLPVLLQRSCEKSLELLELVRSHNCQNRRRYYLQKDSRQSYTEDESPRALRHRGKFSIKQEGRFGSLTWVYTYWLNVLGLGIWSHKALVSFPIKGIRVATSLLCCDN